LDEEKEDYIKRDAADRRETSVAGWGATTVTGHFSNAKNVYFS